MMRQTVAEAEKHVSDPYAVLNGDKTVLTFYYDNKKKARGGMSIGPFNYGDERWNGCSDHIESCF